MAYNTNTPTSQVFRFDDFQITYLMSGVVDPIADLGKAVSWDTTAAGTVKLAAAGDVIVGQLDTYTNRTQEKVATAGVSRKVIAPFPIATGLSGAAIPTVGCTVEGAGAGFVRAMAVANPALNSVTFTDGTFAVVEKI